MVVHERLQNFAAFGGGQKIHGRSGSPLGLYRTGCPEHDSPGRGFFVLSEFLYTCSYEHFRGLCAISRHSDKSCCLKPPLLLLPHLGRRARWPVSPTPSTTHMGILYVYLYNTQKPKSGAVGKKRGDFS